MAMTRNLDRAFSAGADKRDDLQATLAILRGRDRRVALLGVGAHAAAFLGVGRNMEPHLHAIGNGALAAHLNGLGRKMGNDMKAKAGAPKRSAVARGRSKPGAAWRHR